MLLRLVEVAPHAAVAGARSPCAEREAHEHERRAPGQAHALPLVVARVRRPVGVDRRSRRLPEGPRARIVLRGGCRGPGSGRITSKTVLPLGEGQGAETSSTSRNVLASRPRTCAGHRRAGARRTARLDVEEEALVQDLEALQTANASRQSASAAASPPRAARARVDAARRRTARGVPSASWKNSQVGTASSRPAAR